MRRVWRACVRSWGLQRKAWETLMSRFWTFSYRWEPHEKSQGKISFLLRRIYWDTNKNACDESGSDVYWVIKEHLFIMWCFSQVHCSYFSHSSCFHVLLNSLNYILRRPGGPTNLHLSLRLESLTSPLRALEAFSLTYRCHQSAARTRCLQISETIVSLTQTDSGRFAGHPSKSRLLYSLRSRRLGPSVWNKTSLFTNNPCVNWFQIVTPFQLHIKKSYFWTLQMFPNECYKLHLVLKTKRATSEWADYFNYFLSSVGQVPLKSN